MNRKNTATAGNLIAVYGAYVYTVIPRLTKIIRSGITFIS